MSVVEIVLILVGAVIFLLGYFLPPRKKDMDEEVQLISEDEVRKLIDKETEGVQTRLSDIVDETIQCAVGKTERAMEKVSNEKIMAVNEYSDTVLEEINKNHKEVVFLYDMLNDKHDTLVNTVNEAAKNAEEIKQTVKDAEVTAQETTHKLEAVREAAESAVRESKDILEQVTETAKATRETAAKTDVTARKEPESEKVQAEKAAEEVPKKTRARKSTKKETKTEQISEIPEQPVTAVEETPKAEENGSVEIRFAEGKEQNRNSNERILELHKAGKSNMAIAKELGLGIGEVKLVIDLFKGM